MPSISKKVDLYIHKSTFKTQQQITHENTDRQIYLPYDLGLKEMWKQTEINKIKQNLMTY